METLAGKTAVITGAASGIGLAMAHAFAGAGMKVAMLDVDEAALADAATAVGAGGGDVIGLRTDVTDPASFEAAARQIERDFGKVHLLCNNAGVNVYKDLADTTASDWAWLIDVNLKGVANGLGAFLPGMLAHGEGGHIVNTASVAGLIPLTGLGAYGATKYAVVGLSEILRLELAERGIGVSCFCPGPVATQIGRSGRNRPDEGTATTTAPAPSRARLQIDLPEYMDAATAAALVLDGVRSNRPYIMTHKAFAAPLSERHAALVGAFDVATGT
jgi:NAD(P)-dependent dehydrogenase (short-subunit alcohol dehydrogenase family)